MPKLWKDTVAEHRRDVRAAIIDAAWTLAAERGVRGVTMGAVAKQAGISRATLYNYFNGVNEILVAAHAEHVKDHLSQLEAARSSAASAAEGLRRVLAGYAHICFHRGTANAPDLSGLVHSGDQHEKHQSQLHHLFAGAITAAQHDGQMRVDVNAHELAAYCINALPAAGQLPSRAALARLVAFVAKYLNLGPSEHGATGRR